MRRFILCLAALTLFLSACGGDKEPLPDLSSVNAAVSAFNEETLRSVSFLLNVTEKGADKTTFFTQGNASYRREHPVAMSGRMTQIYKEAGTTADIYYKAGAYYRSDTQSKYYLVMDKETLLGQFMCANVPTAENAESGKTASTGAGIKYTLKVDTDKSLLEALFGETLYSSCGLKKPNKARTSFKDTEVVYVVGDDGLKSFKLTARAVLYDTPPYYPNYQTPEKELVHEFDISYELKVVETGEGVEIAVPKTEDFVFLN